MGKNMFKLILLILSGASQRIGRTFNANRMNYAEVAHLKMAMLYLKTIKTCRFLFLSFLGIGVCLVFLLTSLVLFNVSLFMYAPYTDSAKMWLGFCFAAVYLSIAGVAFTYVFSQSKWVEIFNAGNILDKLDAESLTEANSNSTNN